MVQKPLFKLGEEVNGYTVRRFVKSFDIDLPEKHPFTEVATRTESGKGSALSVSLLSPKDGIKIMRIFGYHPARLESDLEQVIKTFPDEIPAKLGRLSIFGAISDKDNATEISGRKYVAYAIEEEAASGLIYEQRQILDRYGLTGRDIETPHITVLGSIKLDRAKKALAHFQSITPIEFIPITLGKPIVLPLHTAKQ